MAPDWLKGRGFGFGVRGSSDRGGEIDQLTQSINEQSQEQRQIVERFNRAMSNFATERSLETCLDALNLSMQLAGIRGKLAESYEYYARMLEGEITRLERASKQQSGKQGSGRGGSGDAPPSAPPPSAPPDSSPPSSPS